MEGVGYGPLARAQLAAGDVAAAVEAVEVAAQRLSAHPVPGGNINPIAEVALARGDVLAARRCADEAVAVARGVHLAMAFITRARVAIARGEPEQAERDAHEALVWPPPSMRTLTTPEALECLAALAGDAEQSP